MNMLKMYFFVLAGQPDNQSLTMNFVSDFFVTCQKIANICESAPPF